MHKALHQKDEMDTLYMSRKEEEFPTLEIYDDSKIILRRAIKYKSKQPITTLITRRY